MSMTAKQYQKVLKIVEQIHSSANEQDLWTLTAQPAMDMFNASCFSYSARLPNIEHKKDSLQCVQFPIFRYRFLKFSECRAPSVGETHHEFDQIQEMIDSNYEVALSNLRNWQKISRRMPYAANQIGMVTLWRPPQQGNFDKTADTMFDMLHPHFSLALQNIHSNDNHRSVRREVKPFNGEIEERCLYAKDQYQLTTRETQILKHIAQGQRDGSIATQLHIETTTVRTHIKHIFRKTGMNNRNMLQAALFQS